MHRLCISVGRNAAAPILKKLFPLICIMRFCKKEKLKSANLYAPINFIFLKILRSSAYWCFIWNIRRHRVKTREQECGDQALFSVWVLFCAHDGPTQPETAKKPSKSRFLAFLESDFRRFLRKILSEIVWEAFLKGQKSPILPKNSHFLACACRFFRLFQDFFGGFYSSQNGSKRPEKSLF